MLSYIRTVIHTDQEDGASAVEYGLLVAAIAALIVIIVFALGGLIKNVFNDTCDTIARKASQSSCACSDRARPGQTEGRRKGPSASADGTRASSDRMMRTPSGRLIPTASGCVNSGQIEGIGARNERTRDAHVRSSPDAPEDDGASAVEYGLLVAAIAALIVIIVFSLGGLIQNVFKDTCDTIASKTAPSKASCSTS